MAEEILLRRGTTLVRRMTLTPGEAMPWHRDPYHRVTVVLRGSVLAIEYRDGGERHEFEVRTGEAGWDEPTDRVHRGVNVGDEPYEEIAIFFLDRPDAVPQPRDG
jgi:quercetin dioxygenase-like cupin family protein